ncbi:unnamed protein product [Sphenostylis stenocarpa]|uniref:Uncharacterized protein n=1 Tax=Sphenostylis stenocarpa TaxID=92480 RepID=A0AA86RV82_9FABA|nr:unnamed protein product [Sphenostylis stenocarpa]
MTSSDDQELNEVVEAEPLRAVKDPVFLYRVGKAFEEQMLEGKKRALQNLQLGELPSHVPMVPNVPVPEAEAKRGRKISSKLLLKVPFSFQPPTFCLEENINLEIALLNRFKEGASWGNFVPKFSAAERLQNWLLERRERFKDEKKDGSKAIQDWKFRSLPAVINFLLHEDFPPKARNKKKAKLAAGAAIDNQDSGSASRVNEADGLIVSLIIKEETTPIESPKTFTKDFLQDIYKLNKSGVDPIHKTVYRRCMGMWALVMLAEFWLLHKPNGGLVVRAQPISVVKDPTLLKRLKKSFHEQLKDANRRSLEDIQHGEHPSVEPTGPMVPEPERKAHRKKRRNTTTKLLFEVPFSFETPKFCLEENIDLDIVLLNRFREGGSWGNHVPQFSVAERLQNWRLEKRERNRDNNNGILIKDWFYHHLPSQQTLRSQLEVFNFLIHGDVPPKDSKKAKRSETAAIQI